MTPDDDYCFYDVPGLFIPEHDEVHVCCVFTWDLKRACQLQLEWQDHTNKPVNIGGPALNSYGENFIPGMYLKKGITVTSRGCNNQCPWCYVWRREGKLREIPIVPGNTEQSNNFLQCSKPHRRDVYDMLKTQKQISFRGGLEAGRLTEWDVEEMRSLRIADLWLACDTKGATKPLERAIELLHKGGFNQNKIRCYVLIGDDMAENEARLRKVYELGALPFAQLFQPETPIQYSREWRQFARTWSRPAAYKAYMKMEATP